MLWCSEWLCSCFLCKSMVNFILSGKDVEFGTGLLFEISRVTSGLVRLGGAFLIVVGIQYLGAAMGDWRDVSSGWVKKLKPFDFYRSTILSRLFLVIAVLVLVLFKSLEWTWVFFAAMNGIGALSMLRAIHNSSERNNSDG